MPNLRAASSRLPPPPPRRGGASSLVEQETATTTATGGSTAGAAMLARRLQRRRRLALLIIIVWLFWNGNSGGNKSDFTVNSSSFEQKQQQQQHPPSVSFLQPSPACARFLHPQNPWTLREIAVTVVDDWMVRPHHHNHSHSHSHSHTTAKLKRAQTQWQTLLRACHGPLTVNKKTQDQDQDQQHQPPLDWHHDLLDPSGWLAGVRRCMDDRLWRSGSRSHRLFGGQWCSQNWHRALAAPDQGDDQPLFDDAANFVARKRRRYVERFVETARCMLQLEFPLLSSLEAAAAPPAAPSNNDNSSIIPPPTTSRTADVQHILLVTISSSGMSGMSPAACDLIASAAHRGWNVTVGTGRDPRVGRWSWNFRLAHKYHYALRTLRAALAAHPPARDDPHRTAIVFVDAHDVLANRSPRAVLEAFRRQPHEFVWSSEEQCFPMGHWPHSAGRADVVCDALFPRATARGIVPDRRHQPQFVNAGGWIGIASVALDLLAELADVARTPGRCFRFGTDQLLSNVLLLRQQQQSHPVVGLDADSRLFVSNAQQLVRRGTLALITNQSRNGGFGGANVPTLCAAEASPEEDACPAFLHFNGCRGNCPEQLQVRDMLLFPPPPSSPIGTVSEFRLQDRSLIRFSGLSRVCPTPEP